LENNEIKMLIEAFKEYRDLIGPIEQNLKAFSLSFDSIRQDIQNLNSGFDGNLQSKLDKIYKELSTQADKAKTLASEVDRFMLSTNKYINSVDSLISVFNKIEEKINTVDSLQNKAELQIEKLNVIIEEKRKSYDIKQLEKNLEAYNVGVQKVSEYINKDVADVLKSSNDKIEQIQACVVTLYSVTFFSFFLIFHPFFFHLCFIGAVSCVLFSLLQISHKMAFLDELTNIPGRRALMTELKQIDAEEYSLAMIDIDHFKRLNDTYGHEVGDQALRTIAATLSQHIHTGTLYRYGGEEFILLFPRKQLDDILDEMESTRVLVSNSDFFLRPKTSQKKQANQPYMASVHITVSCGAAQKQPLQTYDEVINLADQALYKAKQTGRNKTVYNKDGKYFDLF